MNYNNYTQPQYQASQPVGYSGYRPIPQYPQWGPVANNTSQVRPVSSIEEVKACPIDFDGSVFYFTDMANHRIYTKQINLDGTASINIYELNNEPDQSANISFITKNEFEQTIFDLKKQYEELLRKTIEDLQQTAAQTQKSNFNF